MIELFEFFRTGIKQFLSAWAAMTLSPNVTSFFHATVLKMVMQTPVYRDHSFKFKDNCVKMNKDLYTDLYRRIYCQ